MAVAEPAALMNTSSARTSRTPVAEAVAVAEPTASTTDPLVASVLASAVADPVALWTCWESAEVDAVAVALPEASLRAPLVASVLASAVAEPCALWTCCA